MDIRTLTWLEMNVGIAACTAGLFIIFGPWVLVIAGAFLAITMLLFGDFDGTGADDE